MVEWFRGMDLKSGGPRFKFLACHSSVFVLSSLDFDSGSSAVLCKLQLKLVCQSIYVVFDLFVGAVVGYAVA